MGSCFKFGKRKNTYIVEQPYSKNISDGKYQQKTVDLTPSKIYGAETIDSVQNSNTTVGKSVPQTTVVQNNYGTVTTENGTAPQPEPVVDVTSSTTKSEVDAPLTNGDITLTETVVAATIVAAAVDSETVEKAKSESTEAVTEIDDKSSVEAKDESENASEQSDNAYTYDLEAAAAAADSAQEDSRESEQDYETIPDLVPSDSAYPTEAYAVTVTSTSVEVGQDSEVVTEFTESKLNVDDYYSQPEDEDYYSTVADPSEQGTRVSVNTESTIYEDPPCFDQEQSQVVLVSHSQPDEPEAAADGVAEEVTYSVVKTATFVTSEDSQEETPSVTVNDYSSQQDTDYYNTTTVTTTTETTYYNVTSSDVTDITEDSNDNTDIVMDKDTQKTTVVVNGDSDKPSPVLTVQVTDTHDGEAEVLTPTSGQFARDVDDYIIR